MLKLQKYNIYILCCGSYIWDIILKLLRSWIVVQSNFKNVAFVFKTSDHNL